MVVPSWRRTSALGRYQTLAIESPSNEAVENPLLVINQIIKKQGPLIKSGKRPMIRTARFCEGFPVYRCKS